MVRHIRGLPLSCLTFLIPYYRNIWNTGQIIHIIFWIQRPQVIEILRSKKFFKTFVKIALEDVARCLQRVLICILIFINIFVLVLVVIHLVNFRLALLWRYFILHIHYSVVWFVDLSWWTSMSVCCSRCLSELIAGSTVV